MKIKTSELTALAFDYAVAMAEGALAPLGNLHLVGKRLFIAVGGDLGPPGLWVMYTPSTDWAQGGPIIERELIQFLPMKNPDFIKARTTASGAGPWTDGPTHLVAAMRAFVALKLGDEVEIPKELI